LKGGRSGIEKESQPIYDLGRRFCRKESQTFTSGGKEKEKRSLFEHCPGKGGEKRGSLRCGRLFKGLIRGKKKIYEER